MTGRVNAKHRDQYIISSDKGETGKASYVNYLKLEKEKAHFQSTVAERRKKDKVFAKFVKNYKRTSIKISTDS